MQETFGQGRDSNPRPSAWKISKKSTKTRSSRSYISVAVSGSELVKWKNDCSKNTCF